MHQIHTEKGNRVIKGSLVIDIENVTYSTKIVLRIKVIVKHVTIHPFRL